VVCIFWNLSFNGTATRLDRCAVPSRSFALRLVALVFASERDSSR
jgi:hypothetical protein